VIQLAKLPPRSLDNRREDDNEAPVKGSLVSSLAEPFASKYPCLADKDSVVLVEDVRLSCIPRHVSGLDGSFAVMFTPLTVPTVTSVPQLNAEVPFVTVTPALGLISIY
jgi:hypothetical protein